MRVVCQNCDAEFDVHPPDRPPGGAPVTLKFRCSACGHSIKLQAPFEDLSDGPSELPFDPPSEPYVPESPPPSMDESFGSGRLNADDFGDDFGQRAEDADGFEPTQAHLPEDGTPGGALLKQDGKVYSVQGTSTIQRWIVERRVLREDMISADGVQWIPVGTHPDFEVFFQMIERVDHLEASTQAHSTLPPVPDSTPMGNALGRDEDAPRVHTSFGFEASTSNELPAVDEDEDLEMGDGDLDDEDSWEPASHLHDDDDDDLGEDPLEFEDPPLRIPRIGALIDPPEPAFATIPPEAESTDEVDPDTEEVDRATVTTPNIRKLAEGSAFEDSVTGEAAALSGTQDLDEPEPEVGEISGFRSFDTEFANYESDGAAVGYGDAPPANDDRGWLLWVGVAVIVILIGLGWWMLRGPGSAGGPDQIDRAGMGPEPAAQGARGPATERPSKATGSTKATGAGTDKIAADKAAADKIAADKAAADKIAADKIAADKAAADKIAADKIAADKIAADKAAADKAAADKAAAAKAAAKPAAKPKTTSTTTARAKTTPKTSTPSTSGAYSKAGWAALQNNDYSTARKNFVEAVAMSPTNADAHYGLGYAAWRQKDSATAIRHYCKALTYGKSDSALTAEVTSLLRAAQGTCE